MRRIRTRKPINKTLGISFLILLIALGITGFSYSHWKEIVHVEGTVTTGTWPTAEPKWASVCIMKTLNGSFTDPYTGNDLTTPTNLIHVGTQNQPGWPTKFQLIITVLNNGTVDISDAVYDVIENTVEPINATPSKGTVDWYYNHTTGGDYVQNYLNWTIGTLAPSEQATLEIWIQTLQNPTGKYEPTSESQPIEINKGANVTATSELGPLEAVTEGITLSIVNTDTPDDPNIAVITPTLPYSAPWAQDSREP